MTSPLHSQCNRIPYNYSWYNGEQTVHQDNIEIDGLDNASFETISALWLKDKFEVHHGEQKVLWVFGGIRRNDPQRFIVTEPLSGPVTMDNICSKVTFGTWSNGTFETPEGSIVKVDYGSRKQQELILQGLYESGVSNWHPYALKYLGEFSSLANVRWQTSDNQIEDYMISVKNAFESLSDKTCAITDSVEFFFNGVAPLNLDEETITGALDAVGLYANDDQMITIVKAGWFIRMAEAMKSLNPELSAQYVTNARELIASLICELPDEYPEEEFVMGQLLSRIGDPERKELVWWIINKIYALDTPVKTAEDCLKEYIEKNLYGTHIIENGQCIPCEEPTPYTIDGAICTDLVWAEKCLEMEPAGTYIVNPNDKPEIAIEGFSWGDEFGVECIPCEEPTPITDDGINCKSIPVIKRKKNKVVEETVPEKTTIWGGSNPWG